MCKAEASKHVQAINTERADIEILQSAWPAFLTKLREKKTRQLA